MLISVDNDILLVYLETGADGLESFVSLVNLLLEEVGAITEIKIMKVTSQCLKTVLLRLPIWSLDWMISLDS